MNKIFYQLTIIAVLMSCLGCGGQVEEHARSEVAMGTVITLKAKGNNANRAISDSFERIQEVERSIAEDSVAIEEAAGDTEHVPISTETYEMLEIAQGYSKLTKGVFDVTIGAAVELWGIGGKHPRVPSAEELEQVKSVVGNEHLHLREFDHSARLDKAGVKLDLGGVAKGYAVDLVRTVFDKYGIEDGLIDFGTSTIYAIGSKKIGLKNPQNPGELAKVVAIKNSAISTSGDYERFFIYGGKRYHHIIDPRTCAPTESAVHSVSVVVEGSEAHCAMVADILSTALFVSGIDKAEGLTLNVQQVIVLAGD